MKDFYHIIDNEHLKENAFSVPEDYFENNFLKFNQKLFSADKKSFDVPQDYFETSQLKITEKIGYQASDFTVPENYFEDVKDKIYEKTLTHHSTKKILHFNFIKSTAVAASIALICIAAYYLFYHSKSPSSQTDCKTLLCLTKNDILIKENQLDEELLEESVTDDMVEKHFNDSEKHHSMADTNYLNAVF